MRKFIVSEMITLDGVMQAPGGPEEDTSGDFTFGGWTEPYGDQVFMDILKKQLEQADYLLGRKTFDIWEPYWPHHGDFWPAINKGTKYVLSSTRNQSDWENTIFIKSVDDIKKIKNSEGRDIQVWGSSEIAQLLLKHDLVDELWLKTYPLTLGSGKKLFSTDAAPTAFKQVESTITSTGVVMATYARTGRVKTGKVGV
jgi:dihydrofolate reductase